MSRLGEKAWEGKKRGLTVQHLLSLVNALSIMHIVLYLYDVPRFDSTVAFNVLYLPNISWLRLNNRIL